MFLLFFLYVCDAISMWLKSFKRLVDFVVLKIVWLGGFICMQA